MIGCEKPSDFNLFPRQFLISLEKNQLQGLKINSQIKVLVKKLASQNQQDSCLGFSKNDQIFTIQIRKKHILILSQPQKIVLSVYEPNFQWFFQVKQSKKNNPQNCKDQNISSKIQLSFTFKNQITRNVLFQLEEKDSARVCRFIKDLSKICLQREDFHKSFKPLRRCYSSQEYALLKVRDLKTKNEVISKAYRKDGIEKQIRHQYETILEISSLQHPNILEHHQFFQSQNSVYIIFETFEYFLQHYCRRISQKFRNSASNPDEKKIVAVLQIMSSTTKTIQSLHNAGYSLAGIVCQSQFIFKRIGDSYVPKINPYFPLLYHQNMQAHKYHLKNKVLAQEREASNVQILPPEFFYLQQWRYLNEKEYETFLKKSDIFGLGNALYGLLCGSSVFGQFAQEETKKNNKSAKYDYESNLSKMKDNHPLLSDLIIKMTSKYQVNRPQIHQVIQSIDRILTDEKLRERTHFEMAQIDQQIVKQKFQSKKEENVFQNSSTKETLESAQLKNLVPSKKIKKENS